MALERELAAAVAIPIVLAVLFFLPPIAFNLLVAAVALAALWEFYRLAERTRHPAAKTVGVGAAGLLLLAAAFRFAGRATVRTSSDSFLVFEAMRPQGSDRTACLVSFVVLLVVLASAASLLSGVDPALGLAGAASTVFGVFSIALPATAMCYLRGFSPRAVLFLLLLVWGCDSFAYYVGRNFGRHKLAPLVSPNKTWEGSIGGLVGAALIGAAAGKWWVLPELGPARGAAAAALASTAGQIGDLVESMWKRGAGVKDSGVFLPGHGGFYDRIDSLLFAGPVVAAFIALMA